MRRLHHRSHRSLALAALLVLFSPVALAAAPSLPAGIPPLPPAYADWPRIQSPIPLDPAQEARIAQIVAGMTVEQKVGQLTQPDATLISPEDVRKYYIGTVLVGGGGWPKNDRH